jgi:type VI secretion system protein ImpB
MPESSQKFIARNRAPRVQIEYDLEVYGSQKKVQIPFVMGVMANLSGKPAEALPPVVDRKFLDVDIDNFDERLKAMKPRVAFRVPNTLTGEGELNVDITFESMDDFSPAAVARKVDALNKLLQAREQLSNLLSYMDGKSGAEELLSRAVQDPALLQALAAAPNAAAAKADEPAAAAAAAAKE